MADKPLYDFERDFCRLAGNSYRGPSYGSAAYKDYARLLHSPAFRRLQGKMQLFPTGENHLLRTRLTHSLEVAEIAVRIANRLNETEEYFRQEPTKKGESYALDRDVVATAALAHDLGHPPFGHSGESALNEVLEQSNSSANFEGNAQTLRIITNLERRLYSRDGKVDIIDQERDPAGLSLTYRTIASVIKYDQNILDKRKRYDQEHGDRDRVEGGRTNRAAAAARPLFKGYYNEESRIVSRIKSRLLGANSKHELSTIECQIMDIADDIAYSTYDLEDAMIAGMVTPFDVIACEDRILKLISDQVSAKLGCTIDSKDVASILMHVFSNVLRYADPRDYKDNTLIQRIIYVARSYRENIHHATNHPARRRFMETLIENAVRSISVDTNGDEPMLFRIKVDPGKLLEIECLKAYTFFSVTSSQAHQILNHRNKAVIKGIWERFRLGEGYSLVPDDMRQEFDEVLLASVGQGLRFQSDLIAALTDMEAITLYERLTTSRQTTRPL